MLRQLALNTTVASDATFWFPEQASTVAPGVDWVYYFIYWVSVFFFVLLMVGMTLFAFKYKRKKGVQNEARAGHNNLLEIVWTAIPSLIVVAIFYFGVTTYLDMRQPPADAYPVNVTGIKWAWSFTYPNGHVEPELHVPVNRPVKLTMTSEDVIHSFFVPAFRVKQDVVPGRYTTLWFEATKTGEFQVFCTEFCGTKHSDMLTKVIVHPEGEFEKWLAGAADSTAGMPLAEAGAKLFEKQGCKQCHSIDGSPGVGPSMKGLWDKTESLTGGATAKVDENYIRESILEPMAKVVNGFPPAMPTYAGRIKDKEITAIIEYVKTLK